jgi:hypothetical protein
MNDGKYDSGKYQRRYAAKRAQHVAQLSRCTKLGDWPSRESRLLVQFSIALKEEIIALYRR